MRRTKETLLNDSRNIGVTRVPSYHRNVGRVECGYSTHFTDNFLSSLKGLVGITSFCTDVQRDVVLKHGKYDHSTSYIKTEKPQILAPILLFILGGFYAVLGQIDALLFITLKRDMLKYLVI